MKRFFFRSFQPAPVPPPPPADYNIPTEGSEHDALIEQQLRNINNKYVRKVVLSTPVENLADQHDVNILVGTYNVNGRQPPPETDLEEWFKPDPRNGGSALTEETDMVVAGFQEIVPLSASNVLTGPSPESVNAWDRAVAAALNGKPWAEKRFPRGDEVAELSASVYIARGRKVVSDKASNFLVDIETRWAGGSAHNSEPVHDSALPGNLDVSDQDAFVQIAAKQMVGVYLSIWVRKHMLQHLRGIQSVSCTTGFGGLLGNKGAVAIRMRVYDSALCLVCAHMAAGEGQNNVEKRNADYRMILNKCIFKPDSSGMAEYINASWRKVTTQYIGAALGGHSQWGSSDMNIMDHYNIIWLGDLNYRLNLPDEEIRSLIKENRLDRLLEADQLHKEQQAGHAFQGWAEGQVNFQPTFKYKIGTSIYSGDPFSWSFTASESDTESRCESPMSYQSDMSFARDRVLFRTMTDVRASGEFSYSMGTSATNVLEQAAQEVAAADAKESLKRRSPAWCDRILWVPNRELYLLSYFRSELTASDHRPVSAGFVLKARQYDRSKVQASIEAAQLQRAAMESAMSPRCDVFPQTIDVGTVGYRERRAIFVTISNTASVDAIFYFVPQGVSGGVKAKEGKVGPGWLDVKPVEGVIKAGSKQEVALNLEVHGGPGGTAEELTVTKGKHLDAILVLRVEDGSDSFINITGTYKGSVYGLALSTLANLTPAPPHPTYVMEDPGMDTLPDGELLMKDLSDAASPQEHAAHDLDDLLLNQPSNAAGALLAQAVSQLMAVAEQEAPCSDYVLVSDVDPNSPRLAAARPTIDDIWSVDSMPESHGPGPIAEAGPGPGLPLVSISQVAPSWTAAHQEVLENAARGIQDAALPAHVVDTAESPMQPAAVPLSTQQSPGELPALDLQIGQDQDYVLVSGATDTTGSFTAMPSPPLSAVAVSVRNSAEALWEHARTPPRATEASIPTSRTPSESGSWQAFAADGFAAPVPAAAPALPHDNAVDQMVEPMPMKAHSHPNGAGALHDGHAAILEGYTLAKFTPALKSCGLLQPQSTNSDWGFDALAAQKPGVLDVPEAESLLPGVVALGLLQHVNQASLEPAPWGFAPQPASGITSGSVQPGGPGLPVEKEARLRTYAAAVSMDMPPSTALTAAMGETQGLQSAATAASVKQSPPCPAAVLAEVKRPDLVSAAGVHDVASPVLSNSPVECQSPVLKLSNDTSGTHTNDVDLASSLASAILNTMACASSSMSVPTGEASASSSQVASEADPTPSARHAEPSAPGLRTSQDSVSAMQRAAVLISLDMSEVAVPVESECTPSVDDILLGNIPCAPVQVVELFDSTFSHLPTQPFAAPSADLVMHGRALNRRPTIDEIWQSNVPEPPASTIHSPAAGKPSAQLADAAGRVASHSGHRPTTEEIWADNMALEAEAHPTVCVGNKATSTGDPPAPGINVPPVTGTNMVVSWPTIEQIWSGGIDEITPSSQFIAGTSHANVADTHITCTSAASMEPRSSIAPANPVMEPVGVSLSASVDDILLGVVPTTSGHSAAVTAGGQGRATSSGQTAVMQAASPSLSSSNVRDFPAEPRRSASGLAATTITSSVNMPLKPSSTSLPAAPFFPTPVIVPPAVQLPSPVMPGDLLQVSPPAASDVATVAGLFPAFFSALSAPTLPNTPPAPLPGTGAHLPTSLPPAIPGRPPAKQVSMPSAGSGFLDQSVPTVPPLLDMHGHPVVMPVTSTSHQRSASLPACLLEPPPEPPANVTIVRTSLPSATTLTAGFSAVPPRSPGIVPAGTLPDINVTSFACSIPLNTMQAESASHVTLSSVVPVVPVPNSLPEVAVPVPSAVSSILSPSSTPAAPQTVPPTLKVMAPTVQHSAAHAAVIAARTHVAPYPTRADGAVLTPAQNPPSARTSMELDSSTGYSQAPRSPRLHGTPSMTDSPMLFVPSIPADQQQELSPITRLSIDSLPGSSSSAVLAPCAVGAVLQQPTMSLSGPSVATADRPANANLPFPTTTNLSTTEPSAQAPHSVLVGAGNASIPTSMQATANLLASGIIPSSMASLTTFSASMATPIVPANVPLIARALTSPISIATLLSSSMLYQPTTAPMTIPMPVSPMPVSTFTSRFTTAPLQAPQSAPVSGAFSTTPKPTLTPTLDPLFQIDPLHNPAPRTPNIPIPPLPTTAAGLPPAVSDLRASLPNLTESFKPVHKPKSLSISEMPPGSVAAPIPCLPPLASCNPPTPAQSETPVAIPHSIDYSNIMASQPILSQPAPVPLPAPRSSLASMRSSAPNLQLNSLPNAPAAPLQRVSLPDAASLRSLVAEPSQAGSSHVRQPTIDDILLGDAVPPAPTPTPASIPPAHKSIDAQPTAKPISPPKAPTLIEPPKVAAASATPPITPATKVVSAVPRLANAGVCSPPSMQEPLAPVAPSLLPPLVVPNSNIRIQAIAAAAPGTMNVSKVASTNSLDAHESVQATSPAVTHASPGDVTPNHVPSCLGSSLGSYNGTNKLPHDLVDWDPFDEYFCEVPLPRLKTILHSQGSYRPAELVPPALKLISSFLLASKRLHTPGIMAKSIEALLRRTTKERHTNQLYVELMLGQSPATVVQSSQELRYQLCALTSQVRSSLDDCRPIPPMTDPHVAATALIMLLLELPEPIFPERVSTIAGKSALSAKTIAPFLAEHLRPTEYACLQHIMELLHAALHPLNSCHNGLTKQSVAALLTSCLFEFKFAGLDPQASNMELANIVDNRRRFVTLLLEPVMASPVHLRATTDD